MADEETLPPAQTEEELESRHEKETAELEERAKAHVDKVKETAGKGKKAKQAIETAEREVEQWLYELQERQKEELEELTERLQGPKEAEAASQAAEPEVPEEQNPEDDEAERARRKKEKAQKKRQNRADKEAQKEAEKEKERREAGPSARELELESLAAALSAQKPAMKIHEIPSDGHCLYRSVADQLHRFRPDLHDFSGPPDQMYKEVRKLCAASLRGHVDGYAPFAELKEGEDFDGYCHRVESSADWGGELELRALADKLKVRIHVFQAGADKPLVLGDSPPAGPLRVSFHRHYYALGEHYNSVVPS
ncbi:Otud6b [Symbiodinium natans]|uniref:Otud6b protein n=1 Tax=Symbiodinium natans TaxID=878477 RepID=A0A812L2E9_9DINO|nr:Otud6b [Symbiodinium natans]